MTSSSPYVGMSLSVANVSSIRDRDGMTNPNFSYQWFADDTEITGANSSSYRVKSADLGKILKVRVSFTDDRGTEETLTETTKVVKRRNNAHSGRVYIGVPWHPRVDQTLMAFTSSISDADGLTNVSYSYQWIRNDGDGDSDISGATSSTYTLVDADEGKTIKVKVIFTDDANNKQFSTSRATDLVKARPNIPATGVLTITGAAQVGETLTAGTSGIADSDGLTNVSYSYQWIRNDGTSDTDIQDETGSTYTVGPADALKKIKLRVSFSDEAGNEESPVSRATTQVPGIWSGTVTVGNGPEGSGATGYSVFATGMGSITTPNFELDGVTSTVQIVTHNQSGLYLGLSKELSTSFLLHVGSASFESTNASTRDGTSSYIYTWSDPNLTWSEGDNLLVVIIEAAANTAATGVPTISGTVQVGETLTADTSGIADADRLDNVVYSYQWIRNDGGADTDIQDATRASYSLVDADEGKTMKVKVSFTDDAGHDESLTSAAAKSVEPADTGSQEPTDRPHGLTATVSENTITLTWQEPDNFYGPDYHILRHRPEEGEPEPLAYVDFTETDATTFTDTNVYPGVLYVYQVRATIDMFATLGEPSNPIEARVPERDTSDTQQASNTRATGVPVISGTAQVEETLTSSTSGIADADGLTNVSYNYRWVRNDGSTDADIQDATGASCTLVDADESKTIKVRVSFTDDSGHDENITSATTASVVARPNSPATGAPTIPGTAQVGQTLTASTSGIADTDGLTSVSYSYQWIRNDGTSDTDIQDATGSTYSLVDVDEGKTIKVKVSFTDDAGHEESLTSAATAAVTPSPLTVSLSNNPDSHNGTDAFTFQIRFSEEFKLSFRALRDHAFTVDGGTVRNAKRQVRGSNIDWTITVQPDSNAAVRVVLPATTDCDATGAICNEDGRTLSNSLDFTVSGPN